MLSASGAVDVTLARADWDYRVLAPVFANGIAVVGDPDVYACAGDTRLARVVADGAGIEITVLGAGETVRVLGWASEPVGARVWSPATGSSELAVANDVAAGSWEVAIEIPAAGWAKVHVRPA